MILPISQAGDPVLRERARPVVPADGTLLGKLLEDMRDTMRAAPGVGLAAPQVGLGLRFAVIEDPAELQDRLSAEQLAERGRRVVPFHALVNPVLTVTDPTPETFFEGCLSVKGYTALVTRARGVRVDGLDENGSKVIIDATGWYARILQHEIDHLDGVLYVDRMLSRSFMTAENHATFQRTHTMAEARRTFGAPA